MNNPKSNFIQGIDPYTALNLGNIKITEAWLDHFGVTYDKKSIQRSKSDSGQAIIELQVDCNMNATIMKGNPDWKSGRTGTVKIVFQFDA